MDSPWDSSAADRLQNLNRHYENQMLYAIKLLDGLQAIRTACERGASVAMIRQLADKAIATPRPPDPLEGLYNGEFHTGHPLPEYMHLPMRSTDDYLNKR